MQCPDNPGHKRGGRRLNDLTVILPGSRVEDFVWTWQSECLVQTHVLELLRSNGLTGFEVRPVAARFRISSDPPPILWELILTGWAGQAKRESGIQINQVKSCPECGYLKYTGLIAPEYLIDEGNWDGSDFFMVWPMPRYLFVTERVVEVVHKNYLKGIEVVAVPELKPTDEFSPGRLSYFMPERRARELGEPLGIY